MHGKGQSSAHGQSGGNGPSPVPEPLREAEQLLQSSFWLMV